MKEKNIKKIISYKNQCKFNNLFGKTVKDIKVDENKEYIAFDTDGGLFVMGHDLESCEDITIKDICGDLNDLIGERILISDKRQSQNEIDECLPNCSNTWTFIILRTLKGSVTISWLGESNGYYSEDVNLYQEKEFK